MTRSRSFAWIALGGCFVWVLAGGCSASDDKGAGSLNGGSGGSAGSAGRSGGPTVIEPDASVNGGNGNDNLNPLCGEGVCLPDDAQACASYEPPVVVGEGGNDAGGQGGQGGQSSAGQGGQSSGGEGGGASGEGGITLGGASGAGASAGGAAGSGGEGGGERGPEPPQLASYSCQVVLQGNLLSRECGLAGTGKINAPCFSGADCAPRLACVTEGDAGRCLPYCCGIDAACGGSTYCAERPLRKAPTDKQQGEPPSVPVCVPTDECSLEDQYPCPAGADCRCQGDTACMVVRDDGTTTCVKPGTGQQGDTCSTQPGDAAGCAWNHVCSSVTHQCVKICRTDPAKNDCGEQKCQASSELPTNFGVCVGPV